MAFEGYSWEPYTVSTLDGWTLSMFRITGKLDAEGKKTSVLNDETDPVIVMHGGG